MYSTLLIVVLTTISFDMIIAGGAQAEPAPLQNMLYIANYDQCDGIDASNYTLVAAYTTNWECDSTSSSTNDNKLIQNLPNHQKVAIDLVPLASSTYPAGAYVEYDSLYLATGGTIEGKYVYEKVVVLREAYLKKCSSVLGYSYVTTKSASLLINDKLDLNVLISSTGAYEVFKKGCSTVCSGRGYIV